MGFGLQSVGKILKAQRDYFKIFKTLSVFFLINGHGTPCPYRFWGGALCAFLYLSISLSLYLLFILSAVFLLWCVLADNMGIFE